MWFELPDVVEEVDTDAGKVDLDTLDEFGMVGACEVVVSQEGDFAGLQVDLDKVDRSSLAEQCQGAPDAYADQRQALSKYGLVEGQVVQVVEPTDIELFVASEDDNFVRHLRRAFRTANEAKLATFDLISRLLASQATLI